MKKNKFTFCLSFVFLSLMSSCASRFMTVPLTSMTHTHITQGAKWEDLGSVSSTWCSDEPSVLNETGTKAFVDEVTKKAQNAKKSGLHCERDLYLTYKTVFG